MAAFQTQCRRILEDAFRLDDGDIAPFCQLLQPAGQSLDDFIFPRPQFVDADRRRGELDTPVVLKFVNLGDHSRDVKQGFGWNSTPEQTGTAESRFRLHQRNLQSFVRCQERGGVTTRSTAQHDKLRVHEVNALTGQEFDDHVDHAGVVVHRHADVVRSGFALHGGTKRFRIKRDPVHGLCLSVLREHAVEIEQVFAGTDRDDVARPQNVRRLGHLDTVHLEVAVNDPLAGLGPSLRETGSTNHIVQPAFAQDQQVFARVALASRRLVEHATQLPFAQSIVVLNTLLRVQRGTVVRGPLGAGVHAWRIFAPFRRPLSSRTLVNQHAKATVDTGLGTSVTRHAPISPSNSAHRSHASSPIPR